MYEKMYFTLFNAITDALELLRQREWAEAARLLERAQGQTEELFMEGEEQRGSRREKRSENTPGRNRGAAGRRPPGPWPWSAAANGRPAP